MSFLLHSDNVESSCPGEAGVEVCRFASVRSNLEGRSSNCTVVSGFYTNMVQLFGHPPRDDKIPDYGDSGSCVISAIA